jgi:DNA-binding Lrp family transcriptional regulator
MSNSEKLLNILSNGAEISIAQVQKRLGNVSTSTVNAAVRKLRTQGYCVYTNNTASGVKFRLGGAARRIVSAAFESQGSSIFTR